MTIAAGTRLGPYEILGPLGAGGMGEVYRARDTRLDRVVALKVISAGAGGGPEALSRFEREAKAVAALSHPNILALHDYGVEQGTAYSVTELLEGEDLRAKIAGGPVPARKTIEYALQIARGLAAAHEKGIVHRDLKPENLFVTTDGQVKILDFGLARMRTPRSGPAGIGGAAVGSAVGAETEGFTAPTATSPGVVLGTVPYMSPEQVRGQPVDHRSDIFSLGAVLYEMLSGRRAFAAATTADTMSAILKEEPAELAASVRSLPPGLTRIVEHCMEKRPELRFQSARDLAFALESVLGASWSDSGVQVADFTMRGAPKARTVTLWRTLLARPAVSLPLVIMAAAVATVGMLLGARTARHRPPAQRSFRQLTYQPMEIFNARYGPDGRTVYFSARRGASLPEIYSVSPEYPEPRPVGMKETDLLAISSKGEMAVLIHPGNQSMGSYQGTLSVVPVGGTAPRPLVENVRGADWSPDGSQLAVIRRVEGVQQLEYPVGTVLYRGRGYLSHPRISPRGDRVAFFDHPVWGDNRGSVVMVDRRSRRTILADDFWGLKSLAWVSDGRSVLFSGSKAGGAYEIWAASPGAAAAVVLSTPASTTLFDVRPDGQWLLSRCDMRLAIIARIAGEAEERDLSWLDLSAPVRLSADGSLLLFYEQSTPAGPNYSVCVRRTDGSPTIRLGEGEALDLSPDEMFALARVATEPPRLVIYPIGAGEARDLATGDVTPLGGGRYSRNGSRIFFEGCEPGRPRRVYALDLPAGLPRPVTPEGAAINTISPDGSVVMRDMSGAFVLIAAEGGPPRPIPGEYLATVVMTATWSRDGGSILVHDPTRVPTPIEWFNLTTGQRTPFALFDLRGGAGGAAAVSGAVVSEDGRSYAVGVVLSQDLLYTADPLQ